jgi:hypothetical protein
MPRVGKLALNVRVVLSSASLFVSPEVAPSFSRRQCQRM